MKVAPHTEHLFNAECRKIARAALSPRSGEAGSSGAQCPSPVAAILPHSDRSPQLHHRTRHCGSMSTAWGNPSPRSVSALQQTLSASNGLHHTCRKRGILMHDCAPSSRSRIPNRLTIPAHRLISQIPPAPANPLPALVSSGRAGGIRTRDLLNPIQAHYQAVLRPVCFEARKLLPRFEKQRGFLDLRSLPYAMTRAISACTERRSLSAV